jgi:LEA14-like dessication related protein
LKFISSLKEQHMKKMIFTLIVGLVFLVSCKTANIREPEYRDIQNIRLVQLGVLQSIAGVDLIYYNPNNFGVQLSDARGDVYIDDQYLGRFGLNEEVQVGKRSEFLVPAIIKVDMLGAVMNHRDLYKKKEAMIRIEGLARVRKAGITREVPIKYERMQNIEKFRTLVGN